MLKKFFNLLLIFLFIYYIYNETTNLSIEKVKISTDKISNKLRILQISDLHLRRIGRLEKEVISYINGGNFDILVLTGDYIQDNNIRVFILYFL